jgi:hypothetical protein
MTPEPRPRRVLVVERYVAGIDRRSLQEIAVAQNGNLVGAIAIPADETCLCLFANAAGLHPAQGDRVLEALIAGPWLPHTPGKETP